MGVMTTVAGLLPVLVGLKATRKVQLAAAASGAVQPFDTSVYCDGFAPPNATLPAVNGNVRLPVLVFRIVTVVAALVVPTVSLRNEIDVGVRVKV